MFVYITLFELWGIKYFLKKKKSFFCIRVVL